MTQGRDECWASCALIDILKIDRLRLRPNGIKMTERELVALAHQIREDTKLYWGVVSSKVARNLPDRSRTPQPAKSKQSVCLRVCFRPLRERGEAGWSGVIRCLPRGREKPVSLTWEVSRKSTRNLT